MATAFDTQMNLMDMTPEQMDAYFNSRQQYYEGRKREQDLAEIARLQEVLAETGAGESSAENRRFLVNRINELTARTAAPAAVAAVAPTAAAPAARPTAAERIVEAPVAAPVAEAVSAPVVAPVQRSVQPSIAGLLVPDAAPAAPAASAAPAARRSQSVEGLLGSLFGGNELEDLMTPQQRAAINQRGLLAAAAALLQAGGPSTRRVSLGQALGSALEAGQTGAERAQQSALTQMLMRQKLDEAKRVEQMRKVAPSLFKETEVPAKQTIYGEPALVTRDDEGNLLPGAQITPASRQLAIDPARLRALAMLSNNPLETLSQVSKLVPDLRRAGFIGAGTAEQDNPFAIFTADQSLPANVRNIAQQYARSYASGLIDPEKVDERVRQIGEMAQRVQTQQETQKTLSGFREQQLELQQQAQVALEQQRKTTNQLLEDRLISQQQHQEAMRRLAQQSQSIQADSLELRRQLAANQPEQFSYAQKKEFDSIQRNIAEAKNASDSASLALQAASLIPQAYAGRLESGVKGALGAVGIPTEAKVANDRLAAISQQLALKTPKFSGPTSDADAKRYDKAVGDLANPSVSQESKIQAIKDIENLAKKQQDFATQQENYFYQNNKSLRGFKFVPSNPFGQ